MKKKLPIFDPSAASQRIAGGAVREEVGADLNGLPNNIIEYLKENMGKRSFLLVSYDGDDAGGIIKFIPEHGIGGLKAILMCVNESCMGVSEKLGMRFSDQDKL